MTLRESKEEQLVRKMKKSFRTFFKTTEPKPDGDVYLYGVHTNALIDICQQASDRFSQGISSYIMVNITAQHGKSDIVSRRFPPWILINNPNLKIMEGCATGDLGIEMSHDARKCFESVCSLYGTANQKDFNKVSSWKTNEGGGMIAAGLQGTVVGRGAHVCIIDDYIRNRADAESELKRNKIWDSFQSDFMTRLAPVHIVIIVATRWHEDDLCGRIQDRNDPSHDDYNKNYPVFEVVKFPAQNEDGTFLFSERYPDSFYLANKHFLGPYGWQSQAMQEPRGRVGNILKAERCTIVPEIITQDGMYWHWGIDLAHSEAGHKSDPDWTVLTLASFFKGKIYVKRVLRMRKTALDRDETIKNAVSIKPPNADLRVEVVGASKDAFIYIRKQLQGFLTVRPYKNRLGKQGHASILEPIFELGDVIIEEGNWNDRWIKEFKAFPGGKHDDQVDSLFIAINKEILKNNYRNYIDIEKVNTHNDEQIEEKVLIGKSELAEEEILDEEEQEDFFSDF